MVRHGVRRVCQGIFLALVALFLIAGFVRTVCFPKAVNEYENRPAEQLTAPTAGSFLNAQFQDGLEAALSDQLPFSESFKRAYNETSSALSYFVLRDVFASDATRYFPYNDIFVYASDYLVYEPGRLDGTARAGMAIKADGLLSAAARHGDVAFYAFYLERDTDVNFETGEKVGYYEHLESLLSGSPIALSRFEVSDFSVFSERFCRTDHHWNHVGAYEGYLQLCSLLGIEEPLCHGEEFVVGDFLLGSKLAAAKNTQAWREPMLAYRYDFPTLAVWENGERVSDYGHQNQTREQFLDPGQSLTYDAYWGGNAGELVFENEAGNGERLLVLGESFDNAILKLLASHFDATYSVDLRYFAHDTGAEFDLDSYLAEHAIDRVLLLGNVDFFVSDEFNVE